MTVADVFLQLNCIIRFNSLHACKIVTLLVLLSTFAVYDQFEIMRQKHHIIQNQMELDGLPSMVMPLTMTF